MNLEGFETIDEYYDDKNKSRACGSPVTAICMVLFLAVMAVLIVATFVKGKLG